MKQDKNTKHNHTKKKRLHPHYTRTMQDFKQDITWRIFRIMAEFVDGFEFIQQLHKDITVFGSARLPETDPYYKEARKLGYMLAQAGFTIITGGGPGIMEAANRGAYEAGGESAGLNIQLPSEQRINPYVKKGMGFHFFFTRKVAMTASSRAYIFFPGGFGTLDELMEILTLIQTKKMESIPVVLVGPEFWEPIVKTVFIDLMVKKFITIHEDDLHLFKIAADAEEAFEYVKDAPKRTHF